MTNRKFVDVNSFYPDYCEFGNWVIMKSKLTQDFIDDISEDSNVYPYKDFLNSNTDYVSLMQKDCERPMMSNHETETITNQKFLDRAKGDVLIFGLGLGVIIFPLLSDDSITSIDVVEIDLSLIEYVGNVISKQDFNRKVNIVNGDVFSYHESLKKSYDTIYLDIWEFVGEKELFEIKELHKTYHKFLNKSGWIDSWRSEKMINYGIQ